jgi:hypothetical protein
VTAEDLHRRVKSILEFPESAQEHSDQTEALDALSGGVDQISALLNGFISKTETEQMKRAFIESLFFEGKLDRQNAVAVSYKKTSSWIFGESQSPTTQNRTSFECIFQGSTSHGTPINFSSWLESQGGTYWIRGKPGSGKSTLMKYIVKHGRTKQKLCQWAGGEPFVVTSHFFWASGSKLQKSQEGLFRSLLFNIFKQCPDMIPHALGAMTNFKGELHAWKHEEFLEIIRRFTNSAISMRFCFFIDGLDEYAGDHDELIALLQELDKSRNIKLCVASRPWVKFTDAFGADPKFILKLEDFTRDDIREFVHDTFHSHKNFQKHSHDPRYAEIVEEVVRRANGVFLWVFLACRSLLDGMAYSDRIIDLHRRLAHIQPDLESFFTQIILSADSVYQRQRAKAFLVALCSPTPLPLVVYYVLDLLEEYPHSAQITVPLDENLSQLEQMARRLDVRSKGLLEVKQQPLRGRETSQRVEFLHGSVRDFLETPNMTKSLQELAGETFDPHILLCEALTIVLQYPWLHPDGAIFYDLLFHAGRVERDHNASPPCLQRLEPFLAAAIEFGLSLYVAGALYRNPRATYSEKTKYRPLLDVALDLNQPSFTMVQTLLYYGADPNEAFAGTTVWGAFLDLIVMGGVDVSDPYKYAEVKEILGLLLSYGAPLDYRLNSGEPVMSAIQRNFEHHDAEYLLSKAAVRY